MMISRDVAFDESTLRFSSTDPQEIMNDTALDFDLMGINDVASLSLSQLASATVQSQDHER